MNKKKNQYNGWELKFFDKSKNFRNYQMSLIKKYLGDHIAEIGPGNGTNLSYYYDHPKKIDLYEPTKKLYLNLKKKFKDSKKVNFFNKKLSLKKQHYNSILYLDVLEHIKEDEKEIIKAYRSLKKNGSLIINVPAFSHLYSEFDKDVGHHKRYQKKDIKLICDKFKFKKIHTKYYDSIGYILSLLSKIVSSNYRKNFEKKLRFWNSLIPFSKILDFLVFNSFGKSLLIIIKK